MNWFGLLINKFLRSKTVFYLTFTALKILRIFQDENHHLLMEQKQIQAKYIKFSEEILTLRQEIQEVWF